MAFYDLREKPSLTTKEGEKEKYYPGIVYNGTISTRKLLKNVAQRTGFSEGEMEGALKEIMEMVAYYIGEGYRVELGDFGTFSGKIKSRLVEKKTDIRSTSIRFNGVNFRASKEFKMQASGDLERTPNRSFKSSSNLGTEALEELMLKHMDKHGFITRSIYSRLTGRLKWKASNDLKEFAARGIISRMGRGNQMYYVKAGGGDIKAPE